MSVEEESNFAKIRRISQETHILLEEYTNFLIKFKLKQHESHSNKKMSLQKEIDELKTKISIENMQNQKLILHKQELQSQIASEKTSFSVESQELVDKKSEMANLELKKDSLTDQISKLNSKLIFLNKKQEIFEDKKQEKLRKIETQAQNFRKYLGIDIKQEMKNVIKIVFDLKMSCYVMMDLTDKFKVIEIYPQVISFEEVQNVFEEMACFYEFCKFLRNLFVKNIE